LFLPQPKEPSLQEELWGRMDAICMVHKEMYPTLRPERSRLLGQDLITSFRNKLPPKDQETLLRKDVEKLSRAPITSKANANDHPLAVMRLASFLIAQNKEHFPEVEEMLISCLPTLREPLTLNTAEGREFENTVAVRSRGLAYRDCLATLIDLYEKWNRPEEAKKWTAVFREYERTANTLEPKRKFKSDAPVTEKPERIPHINEPAPPPRNRK
jgi:hypothetical protein